MPTQKGRFLNTGVYFIAPTALDTLIENIDAIPLNIERSKGLRILYQRRLVQNFHVRGEDFHQHKRSDDVKRSREKNWRELLSF